MHLLRNYSRLPLTAASGEGCYLIDTDGNRYLDAIAGIGVNALGYSHPRITAALTEQARLCVHTSNLISNCWQEPLAAKLCAMSGLQKAFFSNSGTEAMEAALKAVRVHAKRRGAETRIVALQNSFHGRTFGSLAITGQACLREAYEPFGCQVTFIEPNDSQALALATKQDFSAVILEPVLGEGGIYPLTPEFLQLARHLTSARGALLVADETQCGLGRTGTRFAFQLSGIQPDIVTTAKPLGAGLPIGATLFTDAAAQCLPVHSHGSTFGGGPLACRVALEFLAMLDDLLPHIVFTAGRIRAGLDALMRKHAVITEVRSSGMMFGIQLSSPGQPIVLEALKRGLLINCTQNTVLRLLPPYIFGISESDALLRILDESFEACALRGMPPRRRNSRFARASSTPHSSTRDFAIACSISASTLADSRPIPRRPRLSACAPGTGPPAPTPAFLQARRTYAVDW